MSGSKPSKEQIEDFAQQVNVSKIGFHTQKDLRK
jgi:hypothetical protein